MKEYLNFEVHSQEKYFNISKENITGIKISFKLQFNITTVE